MDRRNHPRTDVSIYLTIEGPGFAAQGTARDISTHGSFIELTDANAPAEFDQARLNFSVDTGTRVFSRQLCGKVVRNEGNAIALRFADNDILGRAVVHELMYYLQLIRGESLPAAGCTHDHTQWPSQGYAA